MHCARILIVEDNTMVAEDCRGCLEHLGYIVTGIVSSGEEAIEYAQKNRPDVILMDIHLRDTMDGITAAEHINAHSNIPVVFLSAYSDKPLLERTRKVSAFGFLVKPFHERELLAMLEITLNKARLEEQHLQMEAKTRQLQKLEAIHRMAAGHPQNGRRRCPPLQ